MSLNSSNVNVMKEAVNALPIMKKAIEKVPLMEQVASDSTGSGIVTNGMPPVNQGYQNMPMGKATAKPAKGYAMGRLDTQYPQDMPPGGNTSGSMDINPVQPMMPKRTKKPPKVPRPGYGPGTFKAPKPAGTVKTPTTIYKRFTPTQAPLSLNPDEVINNITGVQSQLSNNLLNQVNGILANIGEQTMNTVMPNMSGGLVMKMTKPPIARMKSKTMGLVAPGTKCTNLCPRGTKRIAGTCQCAPVEKSPQEKFDNLTNAINQNIDSISKGLYIISNYLPCAACPPCESFDPGMQSEQPSAYEEQPTEPMQEGGRRSGTRRSRMKKSKKTLRNRRS